MEDANHGTTFEEALVKLSLSGKVATAGDALQLMLDELNELQGTDYRVSQRHRQPTTDAERLADLCEVFAMQELARRSCLGE